MDTNQKSWKDRMPPDGHLPASYEVQVCDEGNKTIAVQMLDKAGLKYKISARKGQFYIQAGDMQTFTQVKRVLDQSLDMAKEANHLGFPPEVTPVGTNTPQADVTAATVAVEPKPVKEDKELNESNYTTWEEKDIRASVERLQKKFKDSITFDPNKAGKTDAALEKLIDTVYRAGYADGSAAESNVRDDYFK